MLSTSMRISTVSEISCGSHQSKVGSSLLPSSVVEKYLLYNNLELVTSEQHIPARQASSTSIILLQSHHYLSTIDCASQLGSTFYPRWSTAYTVL